jgi:hypothetical protein
VLKQCRIANGMWFIHLLHSPWIFPRQV